MRKVEAPRNVETGSKPQRWEVAEPAFSPSDFTPARGEGGKWARARVNRLGRGQLRRGRGSLLEEGGGLQAAFSGMRSGEPEEKGREESIRCRDQR